MRSGLVFRAMAVGCEVLIRPHRTLVGVLFVASGVVLLLLWAVAPESVFLGNPSDYQAFHRPVAESLLAGRGLTADGRTLATRYPPGYALLLAAIWAVTRPFGLRPETGVLALNLVSVGLSAVFLYELAALAATPGAGLVAAALWISYPFMLVLTKAPLTEAPILRLALCRSSALPALFACTRPARAPGDRGRCAFGRCDARAPDSHRCSARSRVRHPRLGTRPMGPPRRSGRCATFRSPARGAALGSFGFPADGAIDPAEHRRASEHQGWPDLRRPPTEGVPATAGGSSGHSRCPDGRVGEVPEVEQRGCNRGSRLRASVSKAAGRVQVRGLESGARMVRHGHWPLGMADTGHPVDLPLHDRRRGGDCLSEPGHAGLGANTRGCYCLLLGHDRGDAVHPQVHGSRDGTGFRTGSVGSSGIEVA